MSTSTIETENQIGKPAADVQPQCWQKASKKAKPAKKVRQTKKAAAKPAAERSHKKTDVTALMKRSKGATLAEIMKVTGWQAHTVRGFVSILGKNGENIESSKSDAGERTYKIAK